MSKKLKLKWKISPKPTGRYASFDKRSWPSADFENGKCAAQIICETDYSLQCAKSGNHGELIVMVADHSATPWKWRKLKETFATIENAKLATLEMFEKHPEFKPAE